VKHLNDSQLDEYLDDALDVRTRVALDIHLRICESCSERLEQLRRVFAVLAGQAEEPLAHDLLPGILARLPATPSRGRSRALAAQLGLALGTMVWLSSQALPLLQVRVFSVFRLPQIVPADARTLLGVFQIPAAAPRFVLALTQLHISVPNLGLPPAGSDHLYLASAAIATSALWLVANGVLLRNRSEAGRTPRMDSK